MNRILTKTKYNTDSCFIDLISYLGTEYEVAINYCTSIIAINSITLYLYFTKLIRKTKY